jgi:hypothetical protein
MYEHEAWDGDDLPNPWQGNHDIDYWVWRIDDDRLVPATPDELAHIKEDERTREALFRLEQLHLREWRESRSLKRRLFVMVTWCSGRTRVAVQWLQSKRRHGLALRSEGARAERSSSR